jgi:hypothetical protein
MFVRQYVFIFGSFNVHISDSEYIDLYYTVTIEQPIGKGVEARVVISFKITLRHSSLRS